MSNDDINKLLWLLTKVKPLTKISDLRVRRYSDLADILKTAAARVNETRKGADALENLNSDMSNVDQLVREHGWQDDFARNMSKKGKGQAEGENASPGRTPIQTWLQRQPGGQQQQQDHEDGDESDAAEESRNHPAIHAREDNGSPDLEPGRRPSLRSRTLLPAPPAQLALMPPLDRVDSVSNPSDARTGATTALVTQPNPDQPQCSFCLQALVDDQEALLCGHVFHAYCIERYCEVNSRDKAHACPMRCHESGVLRAPASGDGDNTPNPPSTVGASAPEGSQEPEPEPEEPRAPTPEYPSDVEHLITEALDQAERDSNPVDAKPPEEGG